MGRSPAQALMALPEAERAAWVRRQGDEAIKELYRDWRFWARPEQLAPPGDWRWWVVKTGRGYGKSRSGSEWICDRCEAFAAANAEHLVGLGNRTFGEVRSLQIEGVSGLRATAERRGHRFRHASTAREAVLAVRTAAGWHESRIELHTSREPDLSRGRNFNTFWHDEFASYFAITDEQGNTMFTNVDLGLRADGPVPPQGVATTTPRNVPWLKSLLEGKHGPIALTEGSLYDNLHHLAPSFVRVILDRYQDSPLGPQEIFGQLVEEVEGALWRMRRIEATRITADRLPESLHKVAVGVDPPGEAWGDECGIIGGAAGDAPEGWPAGSLAHLYVVADASLHGDADTWPKEAVGLHDAMPVGAGRTLRADVIAAEVNNGGDMVRQVMQVEAPHVYVHKVRATRGKYRRAEPVAVLWGPRQARGHIVGYLPDLEMQLTTWRPGDDSPDRLDAMVWLGAELLPEIALEVSTGGVYGAGNMRIG